MSDSLRTKTVNAVVWSAVDFASQQGIQLIIGIILARLLLPEEFGLIGMLAIFFGIAQAFLDSGFPKALIHKPDHTHVDTCSVFYFNVFIGLVAAATFVLLAPLVARFYGEPLLKPLMQFLSLNVIVNSFGMIQATLMTKRIDFKTQARITVAAVVVSGVVGIVLAYEGFGVWSLAIQQLCSNVIRTGLLWALNPWRPAWLFSMASLRSMFGFGSRILMSGIVARILQNIYPAVIGKSFGAVDVGFYTRAVNMQDTPVTTMASIIGRVALPVFATIQNDNARLKRGMKQAITGMVLLNFPAMLGLAVVAYPLVLVLLTEKWLPCVPYLQLLCIAGMFFPLHLVNLQLLLAKGRSDLFFRLEVLKAVLQLVALAIALPFGIQAIIWGQIILAVVCFAFNSYYTARLIGYTMLQQLSDIAPYFGASVVMAACVWTVPHAFELATPLLLAAQIAFGIGVFVVLCMVLQLPAFVEGVATVRRRVAPLWRTAPK